MKPARLFVLLFAPVLMTPVSCTVMVLPMTKAFSWLDGRDLQAGERSHLPPKIVLQDGASGDVVLVELEDLADHRRARPALSPHLSTATGKVGEDDDHYLWRQSAAETEVLHGTDDYTHTFRYAIAADGGIVPLHSGLFQIGHMFQGLLAALVLAVCLHLLARRMRRVAP
jgi:hypothetical protein